MATEKKNSYTLSEALDYFDNLEVPSSDESEDEDYEKLKTNLYSASCKQQLCEQWYRFGW